MSEEEKKYRFLLIPAQRSPREKRCKPNENMEERLKIKCHTANVKHWLEDVEWELHEGPLTTYGDWPVENREEFCLVAAGRLPIVREACESGKYNALVLLGGGDPGYLESREIARKYGIPVTANAFAQMHIASILGNRFTIIDVNESINMFIGNLVVQYRFTDKCASIRDINFPLPRPGYKDDFLLGTEREKAERGERSEAVERTVREAVAAIEEDSAEVIMFGCSGTYWLQPFVQKRLNEMGWEIPVLEGYSCAIELAKTMVNLGLDASGLTFPADRPKKWRRRKMF